MLDFECPRCGFGDGEILAEPDTITNGASTLQRPGRAACGHCGAVFAFSGRIETEAEAAEKDAVPYQCVRCPRCKGRATTTSSPKAFSPGGPRIRWHKCRTCGKRFKSIERGTVHA